MFFFEKKPEIHLTSLTISYTAGSTIFLNKSEFSSRGINLISLNNDKK